MVDKCISKKDLILLGRILEDAINDNDRELNQHRDELGDDKVNDLQFRFHTRMENLFVKVKSNACTPVEDWERWKDLFIKGAIPWQ